MLTELADQLRDELIVARAREDWDEIARLEREIHIIERMIEDAAV